MYFELQHMHLTSFMLFLDLIVTVIRYHMI